MDRRYDAIFLAPKLERLTGYAIQNFQIKMNKIINNGISRFLIGLNREEQNVYFLSEKYYFVNVKNETWGQYFETNVSKKRQIFNKTPNFYVKFPNSPKDLNFLGIYLLFRKS